MTGVPQGGGVNGLKARLELSYPKFTPELQLNTLESRCRRSFHRYLEASIGFILILYLIGWLSENQSVPVGTVFLFLF